jgi:hypothetical protein
VQIGSDLGGNPCVNLRNAQDELYIGVIMIIGGIIALIGESNSLSPKHYTPIGQLYTNP